MPAIGVRAFTMTINKNRSDQKWCTRSLSQDNIHKTPEFTWKTQTTKKITESLTNPLLLRDYKEKKKISQMLFTITLTTSLKLNYCASSFIEKIRVTNCDIPKLPLTRVLSFFYLEAFRLDRIRCVSGMFLCSVARSAPTEIPSDSPSTWTCHHLKLQARSHSSIVRFYSGS